MKKRSLSSNQQVDHWTSLPIKKIVAILTFYPFPSFTRSNKIQEQQIFVGEKGDAYVKQKEKTKKGKKN